MTIVKGFNFVRLTADSQVVTGAGHRIMRVELYGTTDTSNCLFYDDTGATGTAIYGITAPFTGTNGGGAQSISQDFTSVGGIPFPSTGIYANITGTSAACHVWFD